MSRKSNRTRHLDRLFAILESCWPGVIGGLVAGFLVVAVAGSIAGGLFAIAGAIGMTWLHMTRGRAMRASQLPEVLAQSVSALIVVGFVFTIFVVLSWAKWLIALAAVGAIVWFYAMG